MSYLLAILIIVAFAVVKAVAKVVMDADSIVTLITGLILAISILSLEVIILAAGIRELM